jgi:hypothetical protein
MNYKRLLECYIRHVYECEGTDFLADSCRTGGLNDADWKELQKLAGRKPPRPPTAAERKAATLAEERYFQQRLAEGKKRYEQHLAALKKGKGKRL